MPAIAGALVTPPQGGIVIAALSAAMQGFAVDYWPPHQAQIAVSPQGAAITAWPVSAAPRALTGARARSYFDDYYNRIHVTPTALVLGNLANAQVRSVRVWNAYLASSVTLTAATLSDPSGIDITLPGALPLSFAPLQERVFDVRVDTVGAPVIDVQWTLTFTTLGDRVVTITGNRLQAWALPPDWGQSVDEEIAWLTDVQQSVDGSETRIPLRGAPRRTWEFGVIEGRTERRILEHTLYDWTARTWALPMWTDVSWLAAPVALGAITLPVDPTDLDYRAGGLVMLWSGVQQYELVEVDTLAVGQINLVRPTQQAWPAGTRAYPVRTAYLTDAPAIARKNDRVITTRARFASAEPCDWPAVAPAAMYLGYPVLEDRPHERDDPTLSMGRQIVITDGDVGLVDIDDISNRPWPLQSHAWLLQGRRDRAAHRSLLAWLQGRAQVLWLPSWADDVELLEPAAGTTLTVAWASISRSLRAQAGRRQLRIELRNGTVLYRQVTSAAELDAARETLVITPTLGMTIDPLQVLQISWMTLSRLASDRVSISHMHDVAGLANVRTSFAGVAAEEP